MQSRLAPLTATTALEPYAGRKGVLRTAWPTLSMDQQRAIIGAALGRVTVSPALKPGRPSFDRDRVRIRPAPVAADRPILESQRPDLGVKTGNA